MGREPAGEESETCRRTTQCDESIHSVQPLLANIEVSGFYQVLKKEEGFASLEVSASETAFVSPL